MNRNQNKCWKNYKTYKDKISNSETTNNKRQHKKVYNCNNLPQKMKD